MIKSDLDKIVKPVESELSEFSGLFKKALKSDVALIDLITKYIHKQKGKKIRPILVLLSAKLAGGVSERSFRGATLVEMLHTATLVHDDVVDNSDTRRGFPSINKVWKNKIAVLMGDFLLAKGLMLSVKDEDYDFLQTITDTVRRMSEGELLQISKTRKLNTDEETYFRIISDKTASLLSTCCKIGALSATDDKTIIDNMTAFGENLGIAFQIRDDILDYKGKLNVFGKPKGADIKEKKLTLPLIYSLRLADPQKAKIIRKKIKKGASRKNINEIINFIEEYGGMDYANKTAREYADKAKENISGFEKTEIKESMEALIDFVINRSK